MAAIDNPTSDWSEVERTLEDMARPERLELPTLRFEA